MARFFGSKVKPKSLGNFVDLLQINYNFKELIFYHEKALHRLHQMPKTALF
jgi:hypothetical protein